MIRNCLLCAVLAPAAFAADAALLNLMMPDAKVIAGANVDQAKTSPFGAYVLARMQPDDPDFAKFVSATGFDPRRDVREIVIASNDALSPTAHWLLAAKGAFDPARVTAAARAGGSALIRYKGIDVISGAPISSIDPHVAVAFLDSSTVVIGELPEVEAAIARRKAQAAASASMAASLFRKVGEVSARNDFWFSTVVPLSAFAGAMPDANLAGAMKGNLLGSIQQASGGLKFGSTMELSVEAIMKSPQDAAALVDVVKFLAGLIQTNRQKDTTAAQVSTLLDSLQAESRENIMTMHLAIPEPALESMLEGMREQRRQSGKPAAPAPISPNKN